MGITSNPDMNFTYDARGLRVVSQPAAGTKTFYIFDGDSLLGEVQNTSGFPATAAYTWGANGLVSERLIGSSKSLWYHFGPQGETRLLTNSTGAVADTYTFMAYGTDVASSLPADVNPFRYGGQYGYYNHPAAPGTGYLCGQRWYARNYGTFYTRDPIGYDGEDNMYAYCGDNPVTNVDPSGLEIDEPTGSASELKMYHQAMAYLMRYSDMNKIINNLKKKDGYHLKIYLTPGLGMDNTDVYANRSIRWDPTGGCQIVDNSRALTGDTINPAIVLGHELIHAYHDRRDSTVMERRIKHELPNWTNMEEKVTILYEQKMIRFFKHKNLGRANHDGLPVTVDGPLDW